jgi:hypothetical protein
MGALTSDGTLTKCDIHFFQQCHKLSIHRGPPVKIQYEPSNALLSSPEVITKNAFHSCPTHPSLSLSKKKKRSDRKEKVSKLKYKQEKWNVSKWERYSCLKGKQSIKRINQQPFSRMERLNLRSLLNLGFTL